MSGANDSKRKSRMMERYKFKIGDRVRCIAAVYNNEDVKGKLGTIKTTIGGDLVHYGVEFDDRIRGGHRCTGSGDADHCADGHGWWCLGRDLEPADEPPLPDDIKISFEEIFKDEPKRIGD